jgi:hypothetical protein
MPTGTIVDQASVAWPWMEVDPTCTQALLSVGAGSDGGLGMVLSKAWVAQLYQPICAAPPDSWRTAMNTLNMPEGLPPASALWPEKAARPLTFAPLAGTETVAVGRARSYLKGCGMRSASPGPTLKSQPEVLPAASFA